MTSHERVFAAVHFQSVDQAPLEYHPCQRGLFEHGENLRSLIKNLPGDFEDFSQTPIPQIPPHAYDADGSYHEFKTDEWGTVWEYRIFAMTGHPHKLPLEDMCALSHYQFPPHPLADADTFAAYKAHVEAVKKTSVMKAGWISIFDKMHALRPFEDALMDIYEDSEAIHALADRLVAYQMEEMQYLIDAGVDIIQFGDDFGTTNSMLLSPDTWRHFFKPRYQTLIDKAKAHGKTVFFHSCGWVLPILKDLKEIGVDSVWPQLTAYPLEDLAAHLKSLKLACALHIDRAGIMTHGTPQQVVAEVHRLASTFDTMHGGSFFYVETDNGFPFANIEALLRTIAQYRR